MDLIVAFGWLSGIVVYSAVIIGVVEAREAGRDEPMLALIVVAPLWPIIVPAILVGWLAFKVAKRLKV